MRKKIDNVIVWKPGVMDQKTGEITVPNLNRQSELVVVMTTKKTHCIAGNHWLPAGAFGVYQKIGKGKVAFVCTRHARKE